MKRDLCGYGPHPPQANWPNQAKLALNLLLNYEEGSELSPLYGDPYAESLGGEFPLPPQAQGVRSLFIESMFEYGARAGIWRVLRLIDKYKIRVSLGMVAHGLQFNPVLVEYLKTTKHEIINRGWRWIDYSGCPVEEEKKHLDLSFEAFEKLIGKQPVGWLSSRPSLNTRSLLVKSGKFIYDSDSFADDLPYYEHVEKKKHLIIPFSLDNTDFRFLVPQGYACGDDYFSYLKDTFDFLYAEGATAPKMMTCSLHGRVMGRAGRTAALEKFLQHVLKHKDVWICTREDIARHWLKTHP
jgi:allantoinase